MGLDPFEEFFHVTIINVRGFIPAFNLPEKETKEDYKRGKY